MSSSRLFLSGLFLGSALLFQHTAAKIDESGFLTYASLDHGRSSSEDCDKSRNKLHTSGAYVRAGKDVYFWSPPGIYDETTNTMFSSVLPSGETETLQVVDGKLISTISDADGVGHCVYDMIVMGGKIMGLEGRDQLDEIGVFKVGEPIKENKACNLVGTTYSYVASMDQRIVQRMYASVYDDNIVAISWQDKSATAKLVMDEDGDELTLDTMSQGKKGKKGVKCSYEVEVVEGEVLGIKPEEKEEEEAEDKPVTAQAQATPDAPANATTTPPPTAPAAVEITPKAEAAPATTTSTTTTSPPAPAKKPAGKAPPPPKKAPAHARSLRQN